MKPDKNELTRSASPDPEFGDAIAETKDGRDIRSEELPVQKAATTGNPVRNTELTFTVQDITERRHAEDELRQQRERFEFVADASDVGFWLCDLPFDKLIWDKRVKNHFWLSPDDDVTIQKFYEQIHSEDREPTRHAIEKSIAGHERYDIEYRTVAPNGRYKWIRAIGRCFYDNAGNPTRFDGITMDVTEQRELRQSLIDAHQELERRVQQRTAELNFATQGLRQLSAMLMQSRDEERRRLARDLHDSLGQVVSAIGMSLAAVTRQADKMDPSGVSALAEIRALVQEMSRQTRTISHLLHPPLLDELGLVSALKCYVEEFSKRSGVEVDLLIQESFGRLSSESEIAIFRIVQECVTNIHRHSASPTAVIRIIESNNELIIQVQDSGHGIPAQILTDLKSSRLSGVGFRGMRERVRHLGGTWDVHSDEHGTTVIARLPIIKSEEAADPKTSALPSLME